MKYSVWMKRYEINHSLQPKGVNIPWTRIGTFDCGYFAKVSAIGCSKYGALGEVFAAVDTKGNAIQFYSRNETLLEYAEIDGFQKDERKWF